MRRVLQFSPNLYQVGLAVGLVSLCFFFGGLILAFAVRIEAQGAWRNIHVPSFLWLSVVLLGVSSALLEAGRYGLRRAKVVRYRTFLAASVVLGLLFLAVQLSAGISLVEQGVTTAANPHGSAFYLFMGIHAVHFFGGLGWLTFLYVRSRALIDGSENQLRKHRLVLGVAAVYWHFMGFVWAILFYFLLRWTQ